MVVLRGITTFYAVVAIAAAIPTNVTQILQRDEVNCKGDLECGWDDWGDHCMAKVHGALELAVDEGLGGHYYEEDQPITCHVECCAFFQNGVGGTVHEALSHVNKLMDKGCHGCGHSPKGEGQLTVDEKEDANCHEGHLCPNVGGYGCAWDSSNSPTDGFWEGQNCDKGYKPDPKGICFVNLLCHIWGPKDSGDPYYTQDEQDPADSGKRAVAIRRAMERVAGLGFSIGRRIGGLLT